MYEKDNIKDNLLNVTEEKNKSLRIPNKLFFEDYSNTESIKNSEAFSELDDDTKSEKEINSLRNTNNDNNINRNQTKSFSHTMNTFIGLKFKKSKIFEEEEGAKSRESYSDTYSKVLNF